MKALKEFNDKEEIELEITNIERKIENLPQKKAVPSGGDFFASNSKEGKYNRRIDKRRANYNHRITQLMNRMKKING